MEKLWESLGNALVGSALGAAAGSRGLEGAGMGWRSAGAQAASRNSDSRFLGAQAAQLQNVYAQAALQGQAAASQGFTTCSVVSLHLPWLLKHEPEVFVTGARMRKLNAAAREVGSSAGDGRSVMPEGEKGHSLSTLAGAAPSDYKPIELETHDEFSAKLAKR